MNWILKHKFSKSCNVHDSLSPLKHQRYGLNLETCGLQLQQWRHVPWLEARPEPTEMLKQFQAFCTFYVTLFCIVSIYIYIYTHVFYICILYIYIYICYIYIYLYTYTYIYTYLYFTYYRLFIIDYVLVLIYCLYIFNYIYTHYKYMCIYMYMIHISHEECSYFLWVDAATFDPRSWF